jgi:hypothetical protein
MGALLVRNPPDIADTARVEVCRERKLTHRDESATSIEAARKTRLLKRSRCASVEAQQARRAG